MAVGDDLGDHTLAELSGMVVVDLCRRGFGRKWK